MSSLLRGIVVSWARLTILSASTSSSSSSASVRDEVADAYGLDVTGCRLLRSCDLYGVRQTEHGDAFADGYQRVRSLRDNDLAALPWFTIVRNISNLRFHLVDKPMFAGTESVAEGWAERILTGLRAAAKDLLG
jgi:hypothetical protein